MSLYSVLKRNTRLALKGSWGGAILILLIGVGVTTLLSVLQTAATNLLVPPTSPESALDYGVNEYLFQALIATGPMEIGILCFFTLLNFLLAAPLGLGMIHWYQKLALGRPAPVAEVFRYFESGIRYRRSVWYEINLSVRCLLWAVPFFLLPGGIYGASLYTLMTADETAQRAQIAAASVGLLLAVVLFLLCSVFYAAMVNRYLLVPYLLSEDDGLTVREAIRLSVGYTKGYRFSLLWFQLSFILWFLLSLLFLFLPFLYVGPYFNGAMAMYARYIIEKNRAAQPQPDSTREFVMADRTPPVEIPEEPTPAEEEPADPDPFREFRSGREEEPPAGEDEGEPPRRDSGGS